LKDVGSGTDPSDPSASRTLAATMRLGQLVARAPLIVWSVNTEGVVTLSEGAGLSALGLKPGEAVGQRVRDQYPDVSPGLTLMERALAGEACGEVMEVRGVVLDVQYFPDRDETGAIVGATGIALDVTMRQRLQEQVQRAAEEWKATFDAVQSPLLLLDPRGVVKRLNRAARDLWGGDHPFQEIVGRPLSDRTGEPWLAITLAAAEGGRTLVASSVSATDEGGRTWDVSANPFESPAGEPSVIVLARDVSAMVALQQSLRRSESMSAMGALLAGVAHEVRNPLFGISAAIDAFENEFRDRRELVEYGGLLRAEVARLTTLMHDRLEYGRPAEAPLGPGRLADVVERAVRSCALAARQKAVALVTDMAPSLPPVLMDSDRLVQVFQNVLQNAVQHTPAGGEVKIAAAPGAAGEVCCQVADTGPGVRPQDRARVFEPFFTRRSGGTGLGLSIVQRIVDEHGGRVTMANRPEGGAVVTIDLRAAPPDATETR
jgi:signal transduction histidine kinase